MVPDELSLGQLELCPPCAEDGSCTEDTVKAWAQNNVCPVWCGAVGLSVYPDLTNTETYFNRLLICGTTPMTALEVEMPPPVCEPKGDLDVETNTTLDDEEEPPGNSGAATGFLSTITAVVLVAAMKCQ